MHCTANAQYMHCTANDNSKNLVETIYTLSFRTDRYKFLENSLIDDKAVFRSANNVNAYITLLYQYFVLAWLQNQNDYPAHRFSETRIFWVIISDELQSDYLAHSCFREIYCHFCYRTVLSNDLETGRNKSARNFLRGKGRHSSFSCSSLTHWMPLLCSKYIKQRLVSQPFSIKVDTLEGTSRRN